MNFNDHSINIRAMTDVKYNDLGQEQTAGNKKYIMNKLQNNLLKSMVPSKIK